MTDLSAGDKAGLVIGPLILAGGIAAINAWFLFRVKAGEVLYRHTQDGGEEDVSSTARRIYVGASRFMQFLLAVILLGLVNSSQVSDPCYFGYDRDGSPDEVACEYGLGMGAITLFLSLLSMAAAFIWLHKHIPHSILTMDFAVSVFMTLLWFSTGAYLAAQLFRKADRCVGDTCGSSGAYARAIAAVIVAFLLFLTYLATIPDALQMYGWSIHKGEAWAGRYPSVIWRFVDMAFPSLIVLATIGSSEVQDGGFCWLGRSSCAADVDGNSNICNLGIATAAISVLLHILYLIHTWSMAQGSLPLLEWLIAPAMAILWLVTAAITSVNHGYTCELFYGSNGTCRNAEGYSVVTAGLVFMWVAAVSNIIYAMYILQHEHVDKLLRLRVAVGNARIRRGVSLFLVSLLALIVFAIIVNQENEDDIAQCYFGRDGCGAEYEGTCSLAKGFGVVVCAAAAISLYFVISETDEKPSIYWVVFTPLLFFFSLATAVVLATGHAFTAERNKQREIEGHTQSSVAHFFVWIIFGISVFLICDAMLNWLQKQQDDVDLEEDESARAPARQGTTTTIMEPGLHPDAARATAAANAELGNIYPGPSYSAATAAAAGGARSGSGKQPVPPYEEGSFYPGPEYSSALNNNNNNNFSRGYTGNPFHADDEDNGMASNLSEASSVDRMFTA